jgi:hypothetical protein
MKISLLSSSWKFRSQIHRRAFIFAVLNRDTKRVSSPSGSWHLTAAIKGRELRKFCLCLELRTVLYDVEHAAAAVQYILILSVVSMVFSS